MLLMKTLNKQLIKTIISANDSNLSLKLEN